MATKSIAEQLQRAQDVAALAQAVGSVSADAAVLPSVGVNEGRAFTEFHLGQGISIRFETEEGQAGISKLCETVRQGLEATKTEKGPKPGDATRVRSAEMPETKIVKVS